MDCHFLLAVRPPEEGKTRLAGRLGRGDRYALTFAMFRHVLAVGRAVFQPDTIILVSRSSAIRDEVRAIGGHALEETGDALNAALEQGRILPPNGAPRGYCRSAAICRA